MTLPDRIEVVVVPVDGSRFSHRGLLAASVLAERLGAEIHLFSAVPKEDDVAEREEQLATQGYKTTVVVDLDPAGALHQELRRLGDAIACMASHGHGRSATLIGSVATDVVIRGHDPVVLAGPMMENPPSGRGVVACLDDDPAAREVLALAAHWARLLFEPLIAVSVAEPAPPSVRGGPVRRAFGPDGDVQTFLDDLVDSTLATGAEVETVAIYDPISAAVGLESWLRDHPALSLVTGSHARAGLERLAVGSVAASIVRHSPVPVLVIPIKENK